MKGIEVLVRDHEGLVLVALSRRLLLPLGPLEAEAKAMDEAVSFARDVGLQDFIFEADSIIISSALFGTITVPVAIDNIIAGTLHKLQDFRRSPLLHVRQQGNKPAHTLDYKTLFLKQTLPLSQVLSFVRSQPWLLSITSL